MNQHESAEPESISVYKMREYREMIASLQAENIELREEIERLRRAIEFYATGRVRPGVFKDQCHI